MKGYKHVAKMVISAKQYNFFFGKQGIGLYRIKNKESSSRVLKNSCRDTRVNASLHFSEYFRHLKNY